MSVLPLICVFIGIPSLAFALQSLNVTISPEHAHITPGDDLNIMCKADKPLTHCQFKVRHKEIHDLSQGLSTPADNDYTYLGEGLEKGDCGVTLKARGLEFVVYVVGCRVRSSDSDWVYAEMTLINKHSTKMDVEIKPSREVLLLPGEPLRVLVDAKQTLTRCVFVFANAYSKTNNKLRFFFDGNTTAAGNNPQGTGIEYYGAGVDKGQCGLQVLQPTEVHNNGAWVDVVRAPNHEETFFFRLIVARTPSAPNLFSNTTISDRGVVLHAWCSVRSRPGSSLSWFLGGERIPDQHLDYIVTNPWTWPSDERTVQQKLTLPLDPSADGKDLWCAANHVALPTPTESARMKITVKAPPSRPFLEVLTQAFYEGAWLEATCTVDGIQPGVKVTWYMGNDIVRRDDKDDDPQPSGSRQRITQKLEYYLQAENNGQDLRCEVVHPLLPQPLQAKRQIRFLYCPPLVSSTVLISCSLAGEAVECEAPQQVGTIAQLACKSGHVVSANIVYRRVRCLRSAKWDRPVFACTPGCGKRNTNSGTVLVSGGEDSKLGEFPWHVGIYETVSPTKVMQICGGTLITPKLVVSAAHCFWHENKRQSKDASAIKLAVGKHLRRWDESSSHVQKRNVSEIVLPLRYSGRVTQYASDIALLRVSLAVDLTAVVNIICVDWDNVKERTQLSVGNNGTVAGWGYTEDQRQSDSLKYVNLPYIDESTCTRTLSEETEQVFTHDKFCAGYLRRNISVCRGDSGGGLAFRDPGTDSYYLRGVVSISFTPSNNTSPCYAQHYTGFTKVSLFIPWILEQV